MLKSAKQIGQYLDASDAYLKDFPGDTKTKFAMEKVAKRCYPCIELHDELRNDIQCDLANVDENGSIIYKTENNRTIYAFTPENYKEVNKKLKALYLEERFEIEPHYIKVIPANLPKGIYPFLQGFVIEETEPVEEVEPEDEPENKTEE